MGSDAQRRPWLLTLLALSLMVAPALQLWSLAGVQFLNFAPDRPWNYLAYGLAAPYVGVLLWRGHPRARFAVYVFLTHEIFRGVHFRRWDAVGFGLVFILLLQLPGARRYAPSIRTGEMKARIRHLTGRR